jgi:hypothetical protein
VSVKYINKVTHDLVDIPYERLQNTKAFELVFAIPTLSKFGSSKRKSTLKQKVSGMIEESPSNQANIHVGS